MKCSEKCIHQYFCKFKEEGSTCDYYEEELPHITDEQISDAFQVAIANYWEEKSKHLTPPPSPSSPPSPCCDCQNIGRKIEQGEWIKKTDGLLNLVSMVWFVCSECGVQQSQETPFCPFCGADMREGDEA